jgi:hypothetical protein
MAYDQTDYRFRNDDGSETAATWKAAANTATNQATSENFRVRFVIASDAFESGESFDIEYNKNSGSWTTITGSTNDIQYSLSTHFADLDSTTQQVGSGTFSAGDMVEAAGGTGGIAFAGDDETEVEFCLTLIDADVSDGDTIELRCFVRPSTAIDTYSETASLTVGEGTNIDASTDALTLTEFAASIAKPTNVATAVDALTLTEFAAAITSGTAGVEISIHNDTGSISQTFNQSGWNDVTMLNDEVENDSGVYTLDGGNNEIDVADTGRYLILYNVSATAAGAAGTNRRALNTRIQVDNVAQNYGFGSLYCRESGGSNNGTASGAAFVDVDATGEGITIQYDRSDTQNPATFDIDSIQNQSSVQLLKVDPDANFGFFRFAGTAFNVNENASITSLPIDPDVDLTWTTLSLDTTDEADTGFSRSTNTITVPKKHLLVCFGAHFVNPASRANGLVRLTLDGSEVLESYTTAYVRNSNGHTDAWASGICMIDATGASSAALTLEGCTEQESTSGQLQVDEVYIQIMELADGDFAHLRSNAILDPTWSSTTPAAVDYVTEVELDTGSFGHPTNSELRMVAAEEYLILGGWFTTRDGVDTSRKTPETRWYIDGSAYNVGTFSAFNRGDQSTTSTVTAARSHGAIIRNATTNRDVQNRMLTHDVTGNDLLTVPLGYGWMQGLHIESTLLPPASGDTNIAASVDALTLTENAATVNAETSVAANVDTLTLVEQAATISLGVEIDASVDALALTENTATVALDVDIAATVDALIVTELQATISLGVDIAAGVDTLTLVEQTATVNAATNVNTTVDFLSVTGLQANVNAALNVGASVDPLTLATLQAGVSLGVGINTNVDALTLSELVASIQHNRNVAAGVDALTLSELQATISTGGIIANVATLTLVELASTVNAALNVSATADALTLTEQAASVTLDGGSFPFDYDFMVRSSGHYRRSASNA